MAQCLFCRIAQGDTDTTLLYETDTLVAFRDIVPQAPHHFLVIPKQHIASLNALERQHQSTVGALFMAAQHLANTHQFDEAGYRTVINCNEDGGQTVYHLHLHVLGGRMCQWPPG